MGVSVAKGSETTSRAYERQLIGRVRAGDAAAMRELIDLHKDRLFAFIWRMIRNFHDAEEICQDAFLKAFASLETFSVQYRFSTWLFTIGYRICLNRIRRKRAVTGDLDLAKLTAAAEEAPWSSVESEEAGRLKAVVWEAVDGLSPPQRASVLLFYRHEMSCQSIARVLELPVATVKSHLHRARKRLRESLEAMDDQDMRALRNLSKHVG